MIKFITIDHQVRYDGDVTAEALRDNSYSGCEGNAGPVHTKENAPLRFPHPHLKVIKTLTPRKKGCDKCDKSNAPTISLIGFIRSAMPTICI